MHWSSLWNSHDLADKDLDYTEKLDPCSYLVNRKLAELLGVWASLKIHEFRSINSSRQTTHFNVAKQFHCKQNSATTYIFKRRESSTENTEMQQINHTIIWGFHKNWVNKSWKLHNGSCASCYCCIVSNCLCNEESESEQPEINYSCLPRRNSVTRLILKVLSGAVWNKQHC